MIHVKFPSSYSYTSYGATAPCECGVKMAYECSARPELCGVEPSSSELPEGWDIPDYGPSNSTAAACVNLVKEMIEEHQREEENNPSSTQVGGTHYSEMSIQPWCAMKAWMDPEEYCGYHVGTVLGYLSRHKKKGGLQDIKKSLHHLSELVRYFENEEEYPW